MKRLGVGYYFDHQLRQTLKESFGLFLADRFFPPGDAFKNLDQILVQVFQDFFNGLLTAAAFRHEMRKNKAQSVVQDFLCILDIQAGDITKLLVLFSKLFGDDCGWMLLLVL